MIITLLKLFYSIIDLSYLAAMKLKYENNNQPIFRLQDVDTSYRIHACNYIGMKCECFVVSAQLSLQKSILSKWSCIQ